MFVDPINSLNFPAWLDIMPKFKVCIKCRSRRWMASNIMPRVFVDHHVLMLRAGLLKEFFNAIFKSRGIVLVTGDNKRGYGHCLHGLRAMNV